MDRNEQGKLVWCIIGKQSNAHNWIWIRIWFIREERLNRRYAFSARFGWKSPAVYLFWSAWIYWYTLLGFVYGGIWWIIYLRVKEAGMNLHFIEFWLDFHKISQHFRHFYIYWLRKFFERIKWVRTSGTSQLLSLFISE